MIKVYPDGTIEVETVDEALEIRRRLLISEMYQPIVDPDIDGKCIGSLEGKHLWALGGKCQHCGVAHPGPPSKDANVTEISPAETKDEWDDTVAKCSCVRGHPSNVSCSEALQVLRMQDAKVV